MPLADQFGAWAFYFVLRAHMTPENLQDNPQQSRPIDINQYTDTMGDFSSKELRASEWYVRHRVMLGKIGTGILLALCIGLNGYALIAWGDYLFFGMVEDARMEQQVVASIQNYNRTKPLYQARGLEVSNVSAYALPDDRYDFVARVGNTNTRYVGEVTYIFEYTGGATNPQTAMVLPGTTRPVVAFGVKSALRPENTKFTIQKIVWHRINPHKLFDPQSYMAERIKFDFTDFNFVAKGQSDNTLANTITFDIRNKSSYSFWNPLFYIELLNGTQTVGVMEVHAPELIAGETRNMDVRNTISGFFVTDIRVTPLINVFDPQEFMPAQVTGGVPNLDIDFSAQVSTSTAEGLQ